MSIKHTSETPTTPYGPVTGISTPEPKNDALSKGTAHDYTSDTTPGTSRIVQPGHIPGGPGHADCDHE